MQRVAIVCVVSLLCVLASDTVKDSIVQFVVSADEQSAVTRAFPGASVDYTWNNVFVVTVWTGDPEKAIPSIQSTLDQNTELRVLVSPYTISVATQRWLQYNGLWVLVLVLTFVGGCVCGLVVVGDVCRYKNRRAAAQHPCRARC